MKKHIKTFENHLIVKKSELDNWSADRVINNHEGKFSYIKDNGEWVRRENITNSLQNKVIWMTEEESKELNLLYKEYTEIHMRYKEMVDKYRPI